MTTGLAHSVQVRLVRHAKQLGIDPNVVLVRYACERLLQRLSRSPHVDRFVLMGALLLLAWLGETIRPTRDADLLGFGELDREAVRSTFVEICAQPVEPDGLEFDAGTLRIRPIRVEDAYGGLRVEVVARLGKARIRVQVDVGVGDAPVPAPRWLEYPSLLDLPRPRIRACCPKTAISEKIHAMVELGTKNNRMRDFFDVHLLASRMSFEGSVLVRAVRATFDRRRTAVPLELPTALTREFADVPGKAAQWTGFVRRLAPTPPTQSLADVIEDLARFAGPVLLAVGRREPFAEKWPAGGPWG